MIMIIGKEGTLKEDNSQSICMTMAIIGHDFDNKDDDDSHHYKSHDPDY